MNETKPATASRVSRVHLENFTLFEELDWQPGAGFNVMIGPNDSGKTLLLKVLYACVRSREAIGRNPSGDMRRILSHKLIWTFQPDRLGQLVRKPKPEENPCHIELVLGGEDGSPLDPTRFRFTYHAESNIGEIDRSGEGRPGYSIFIPGKEVLSIAPIVKESRQEEKFGFDDTVYDLLLLLEREPSRGAPPFGNARRRLEEELGGRIQYEGGRWHFDRKHNKQRFPVSLTAEGIKKIAILDRLIVNRSLSPDSILFIDEPESFLHPALATTFLDILQALVRDGVQVFMATHSYFVLKKLQILATERGKSMPVLNLGSAGEHTIDDLVDGMPENPIVDEAIRLYEEEVNLAF